MYPSLADFTAAVSRLGQLREKDQLQVRVSPLGSVTFVIAASAQDVPPQGSGLYADIYDVLGAIASNDSASDLARVRSGSAEEHDVVEAKFQVAAAAFPPRALRPPVRQRVRRHSQAWRATTLLAVGKRSGRLAKLMARQSFRQAIGNDGRRIAWNSLGAKIAEQVGVSSGVWMRVPGNVSIGSGTKLGGRVTIESYGEVSIGRNVIINDSDLFTTQHDVDDPGFVADKRSISIGDYAWLPRKVIVLPGVQIGNYAVIGTGSVVSRDIPDYGVAVGNPASVIKERARIEYTYVPSRVSRGALRE